MYASNLPSKTKVSKRLYWKLPAIIAAAAVIFIALPFIWISSRQDNPATDQPATLAFDKAQFSLDDPASPWVVVNKQRPLSPKTYTPASMRPPAITLKGSKTSESMQLHAEAAQALESLVTAAQSEDLKLVLVSGYRSHNTQKTIYDSEVKGFGQAVADQQSARPGHSEHQTGWAADLGRTDGKCDIDVCFADTPEGQWLAANAHKYGFVIRYAPDKTDVTGYVYEPWHLRYVGVELAEEMHRTGIQTLEEFFNLAPAPGY